MSEEPVLEGMLEESSCPSRACRSLNFDIMPSTSQWPLRKSATDLCYGRWVASIFRQQNIRHGNRSQMRATHDHACARICSIREKKKPQELKAWLVKCCTSTSEPSPSAVLKRFELYHLRSHFFERFVLSSLCSAIHANTVMFILALYEERGPI